MPVKSAIVFGGAGALGRALVKELKGVYNPISIDYALNPECTHNFKLDPNQAPQDQLRNFKLYYDNEFGGATELSSVLSVAGGWEGEGIDSPKLFESYKSMMDKNLLSSLMAGHLAYRYLANNGLLLFTGAEAVYNSRNPSMLTYSVSKSAVHALAADLSKEPKFQNRQISVVTILPTVLDTENNRKAMPDVEKSTWLPTHKVAELTLSWIEGKNRPNNGTFVELNCERGAVIPKIKNK